MPHLPCEIPRSLCIICSVATLYVPEFSEASTDPTSCSQLFFSLVLRELKNVLWQSLSVSRARELLHGPRLSHVPGGRTGTGKGSEGFGGGEAVRQGRAWEGGEAKAGRALGY